MSTISNTGTLSSAGIGSGLNVTSIVSQLVALEKAPLTLLGTQATAEQAQISSFGQIQSQISALTDAATAMSNPTAWTASKASSSNTAAASITATSAAQPASFSLDVDALATQQSISSAPVTTGGPVGSGTLSFQLGTWNTSSAGGAAATISTPLTAGGLTINGIAVGAVAGTFATLPTQGNAVAAAINLVSGQSGVTATSSPSGVLTLSTAPGRPINVVATAGATAASGLSSSTSTAAIFVPATAAAVPPATTGAVLPPVTVTVGATDTVAAIASKINAAGAGVVATAFNDGSGDRLMLSAQNTGAAMGFRVQSADAPLAGLVFDPQNNPGAGMATAGIPVQYGQDAKARINGIAVTSNSNTLASNIPGVTINLLATTTTGYAGPGTGVLSPATLNISTDVTPGVGFVQSFVTAYNTLNTTLNSMTKYDAATQTAGMFQGDSAVVGIQNVMRRMLGSTSMGASSQYLSDVGVELQVDGSLNLNTTKLSTAANNGTTLRQLFTNNNNNPATNGFALKFRDFGKAALGIGGMVTNEATALSAVLADNAKQQTAVNDRATALQTQLQAQYSALDAQMASLNALNAYVTQQVTQWNKSTA